MSSQPPVASRLPSWALSVARSRPLAMSQSVTVPCQLPVAKALPSGEIATPAIAPTSRSVARSGPTPNFQSLMVAGVTVADFCALRTTRSWPVAMSHSLALPSAPLLASIAPLGEKATEKVLRVWPSSANSCCPDWASHTWMVGLSPAVANCLPSAENLTQEALDLCAFTDNSSRFVAMSSSPTVQPWVPE